MDRNRHYLRSGGDDIVAEKDRSIADELAKYADRSVYGLQRGAGEFGDMVRFLLDSVPEPVDRAAGFLGELVPGANVRKGVVSARQSRGAWDRGDYPEALRQHADAISKGADDLWWLFPGGGIVPRMAR